MRSVMSPAGAALRAHLRSAAAPGTPRRGTAYWIAMLFLRAVGFRSFLIRIDDARHQRMAHHVLRAELGKGDAAHVVQDAARLDQPALLAACEVDLRDVAVHHCLGAEAYAL